MNNSNISSSSSVGAVSVSEHECVTNGSLGQYFLRNFRPNKVKNMFLVLLPGHFCEVVMVTFLFTACCYSYTV